MRVIASDKDGYFAKGEEIDGAIVYRGGFELRDGNKVIERCVAAIIEEDGEPVRFELAFGSTQNHGIEHVTEVRTSGEYAVTFAELVSAACERLRRHSGPHGAYSGDDFTIDLDI